MNTGSHAESNQDDQDPANDRSSNPVGCAEYRPSGIVERPKALKPDSRTLSIIAAMHDIRNQLQVAIALLEFLNDNDLPDAQRVDLMQAKQAIESASEISRQTLTLESSAHGQLSIPKAKIELSSFLQNVLRQNKSRRRTRLITAEKPLWIIGNEHHLARVINNLIDNAIKFSTPESNITVTVTEGDQQVIIRIKDGGKGIMNPEKIFDAFVSQAQINEGFGIGLAYCRMICQIHGGEINAQNNMNEPGCCVTITIPVNQI